MKRVKVIVLSALAVLLAACGGTGGAAPPPKASGSSFPVVLKTSSGNVRIASRPHRILCLTASGTQMLYAVGAGKQVVGVDKYSTYPARAPRTRFTGAETSAEDYLPLKPDLVILSYDTGSMVAQLKKLDIPAIVIPPATNVAGAEQEMVELARATGHLAAARAESRRINRDLAAAKANAHGDGRGATYYIEFDQTYYSATSKTFVGSLFSLFGMRDIADAASKASSGYPQLSAEYILKANPDYVFLADTVCCHQTPSSFAARPGFSDLKAVTKHHVVGVNDSVASQWGPHSLEVFVHLIARVLTGKKDG